MDELYSSEYILVFRLTTKYMAKCKCLYQNSQTPNHPESSVSSALITPFVCFSSSSTMTSLMILPLALALPLDLDVDEIFPLDPGALLILLLVKLALLLLFSSRAIRRCSILSSTTLRSGVTQLRLPVSNSSFSHASLVTTFSRSRCRCR